MPKDLRIGNYVNGELYETGCSVTLLQYKVKSLGEKTAVLQDRKTQSVLNYQDIKPISLTSEWLLKFGFTEVNTPTFENIKLKYYCKDAVCLFFNGSPPENTYLTGHGFEWFREYYASTAKWIDSVHELMNYYYAVTGKDMTIKE